MPTAQDLQIRLVLRESPKAMVIGICSAWLLAFGMWEGSGQPDYALRAFGWASIITLLLARGAWIAGRPLDASNAEVLDARSRRVQRNAAVLALLWGSSSFAMSPGSDPEHQLLLVAAIALITMGGAVGRAVHVPRVQLFVMITTVVFASGLLLTPGRFQLFIGLGYLLFGAVIVFFCRAQENTVRREREMNLAIERLLRDAEDASACAQEAQQQAERANAAKTRFLAAASHDLRQPMHSISLLMGVLRTRLADPAQVELAEKVQSAVTTMESLFGNLLDISKLDAGAVQPHVENVDLDGLLRQVEQVWTPQAVDKGLRLRVRPCRLIVKGDAALLARIVGNLVANAIRYTRQGGVLVACRRRGATVRLQVWDSGPGIEPRFREAIFEEFFRIDAPGVGQEKGLGLGLSIVQRCAHLLGYALRVDSREGKGSVFTVTMPLAGGAAVPPGTAAAVAVPALLAGRFIVVVDDDETNAQALVDALQAQHCHVVAAASCDAALAQLQQHLREPDLIVTDYQLAAGRDGFEVIERLRQHYDDDIAALIVTANTDAALIPRAQACGARLLHKPIGLQRLLEAMLESLPSIEGA